MIHAGDAPLKQWKLKFIVHLWLKNYRSWSRCWVPSTYPHVQQRGPPAFSDANRPLMRLGRAVVVSDGSLVFVLTWVFIATEDLGIAESSICWRDRFALRHCTESLTARENLKLSRVVCHSVHGAVIVEDVLSTVLNSLSIETPLALQRYFRAWRLLTSASARHVLETGHDYVADLG
eukprot:533479-Amphidinium_carterae.1